MPFKFEGYRFGEFVGNPTIWKVFYFYRPQKTLNIAIILPRQLELL
jgi:hypothetical protein